MFLQVYVDKITLLAFFCFFFQAEDGIRDDLVTGVQTCALPISPRFRPAWTSAGNAGLTPVERTSTESPGRVQSSIGARRFVSRSEERRVGKECRTRWLALD